MNKEVQRGDKEQLYESFFRSLVHDLRKQAVLGEVRCSGKNNWRSFRSGSRGFTYAVVFPSGGWLRVEIYIDLGDREENLSAYAVFHNARAALEHKFGEALDWEPLKERRACRIAVYRQGKIEDRHSLDEYRRWASERLIRFRTVFGPMLPGTDAH
jgi:uncharacterized protein DUF4268